MLASSESYRQAEDIEAAGPVQEVVALAPGLGLHWQALLSHLREALANLELETANVLDLNRRSPTSLIQEKYAKYAEYAEYA